MKNLAAFLLAAAGFVAAGCAGTVPKLRGVPEQGISAVIVGGRFFTPAGETLDGKLAVNLDGEGDQTAEVYRLPIKPRQSLLYQVEPGTYQLSPTRSIFGFHQPRLAVRIAGRSYSLPFPRDIMRKEVIEIKPRKIYAIGVFEVRLQQALPSQPPMVKVRLDDSLESRRQIVQDIIHDMLNPAKPAEARESAVAWSQALQNTLMELSSRKEQSILYKGGQ